MTITPVKKTQKLFLFCKPIMIIPIIMAMFKQRQIYENLVKNKH